MNQSEQFSETLGNHIDEERIRDALMAAKMEEMSKQIQVLTEQVQTLVTSWNQARGVVSFIKWTVGISGSITAFIVFIKDHIK